MTAITKDMTILEVIQNHPETVGVLQELNLGCLGCIAASGESLEQGLAAHGLNVSEVVDKLNTAIAK
ncbi:disulfide oxidoreductase [Candidatus Termititenax persephonae]|uniref:Disulfide oxidoreductase n=1 Tax=Candidatus Termititenax persephonae TaxID=2218525 RepID=A0A388TG44_9BACT|nr:disulfide oxidoreductase [Candidatus Termititenax persephonae]